MNQPDLAEYPVIPVVKQPTGLRYFLGTWTGRIQIINAAIFLFMIIQEPSALMAPSEGMIRWIGCKSLVEIANGEWWRFFTPIFVHIGALHFFFNAMGLYYIGYQLEHILGKRWFLAVYFLSGILGNFASCLMSVKFSAGASGAIFGLLGSGFRLEGLVSEVFDQAGERNRPRKRIYTSMAVTNIALGLILPVIDNAAHIGGFLAGWLITEMMLRLRPNRLRKPSRVIAVSIAAMIVIASSVTVYLSTNKSWVVERFFSQAEKSNSSQEVYYLLSEGLKVDPLNIKALLFRGKLLLQNGEGEAGLRDVSLAFSTKKVSKAEFESLVSDLQITGHGLEAELVKRLHDESAETDL
jgi:membrane associated rhomboid family serine protease